MRSPLAAAMLLASLSCAGPESAPAASGPPAATTQPAREAAAPAPAAAQPVAPQLQIRGTSFVRGESPFEWRGITAFRLAEQIAHGGEAQAIAYLDWARARKVTIVRVLTMAKHLFQLSPANGLTALPRLLTLAAERGLIVEIVALADTADTPLDLAQHVKAIATIAAAHPNAVVEIANEPSHSTQDPRLHDPAFVKELANLVPKQVPVALGAGTGADAFAAGGGYATWHSPRVTGHDGWAHVLETSQGADLVAALRKPLINDEPMGAAESAEPGRRDNDPARFAAIAVLSRLAGLGVTFHYEGGLQGHVPVGRELACFEAWAQALDAMQNLPDGGRFIDAGAVGPIVATSGARGVFGRHYEQQTWIAVIDPGKLAIQWQQPWHEVGRQVLPGVVVLRASRMH